jgi:hypothetical protein
VILAVPEDIPATTPVAETVAVPIALLDQVPPPALERAVRLPIHTALLPDIAAGFPFTVTIAVL